jgi:hypothetical protein
MFPIGLLEKHTGRLGKFLSRKVNKLAQTSHSPNVNPDFHCNISMQSHIYGKSTKISSLATIIMSPMFSIAAGCTLCGGRNATGRLVRMAQPGRVAQTFR